MESSKLVGAAGVPESHLASLGLVGCVKEAARLIHRHRLSFLLITVATATPFSILSVLRTLLLVHPQGIQDDFDDGHEVVSLWPSILAFEEVSSMQPREPKFTLGALHGVLGQTVFFIHLTTICMTVASMYNKSLNVNSRSIAKPYIRMIVTSFWVFLISKASDVAFTSFLTVPGILPFFQGLQDVNPVLYIGINMAAKVLPLMIMLMFFEFVFCVSIVEGVYGQAALARSVALTTGKRLKVFALMASLLFLYMLPRIFPLVSQNEGLFVSTTIQYPDLGSYPQCETTIFLDERPILWGLQLCLNVLIMPIVFTFAMLVRVVFYFSCKSSFENAMSKIQGDFETESRLLDG